MRLPCPCYGCTERFTACSDRCPKDLRGEYGHKAWIAEREALKDAIKQQKRLDWTAGKRRTKWAYAQYSNHGTFK